MLPFYNFVFLTILGYCRRRDCPIKSWTFIDCSLSGPEGSSLFPQASHEFFCNPRKFLSSRVDNGKSEETPKGRGRGD